MDLLWGIISPHATSRRGVTERAKAEKKKHQRYSSMLLLHCTSIQTSCNVATYPMNLISTIEKWHCSKMTSMTDWLADFKRNQEQMPMKSPCLQWYDYSSHFSEKNWEDRRANQDGKQAGVSETLSFISRTLVQPHVSKHPSCLSVLEQVTETHQKSRSVNGPDIEGLQLGTSPERQSSGTGSRSRRWADWRFGQGSDIKGIVHLFAFL